MKPPVLSASELIKVLHDMGFTELRQKGSHKFFKHPDGRATVVPVHAGRDIGRGLLRKILNEIEVDRDEFLKHIK
jgi:predicted RNA binding protein YcfA (HicA-like mRNA interferase family)